MAEQNPNPVSEEKSVKSPNFFQRVKEEIEAMGHHGKSKGHQHHHKETHGTSNDIDQNTDIDDVKGPGCFQRVKEEIEAMGHHGKSKGHHRHHKETHGTSDDIDENTDIHDVKAPNFFERVKEEIEAVVEAVTPKRSSKKE